MLHRFLTLTGVPELRAESATTDNDVVPEVELLLPVEMYWQAQEVIRELRYLRQTGQGGSALTDRLHRMLIPFVVSERERQVLVTAKKTSL